MKGVPRIAAGASNDITSTAFSAFRAQSRVDNQLHTCQLNAAPTLCLNSKFRLHAQMLLVNLSQVQGQRPVFITAIS